jgi:hypothetical protein
MMTEVVEKKEVKKDRNSEEEKNHRTERSKK